MLNSFRTGRGASRLMVFALSFSLFTATTVSAPRQANAIIAAPIMAATAAAIEGLLVATGITLASGPAFVVGGVMLNNYVCTGTFEDAACVTAFTLVAIGALALLAGIIMLDETNGTLNFETLSPENASAMGLSVQEWSAYEDEREELNAVSAEIQRRLVIEKATKPSRAAEMWNEYRVVVSPEAIMAAAKIAKNAAQVMSEAKAAQAKAR